MRQPYENLRFRIHNLPKSTDLLEEFPELKRHEQLKFYYIEDFRQPLNTEQINQMIRYLVYLYDPKSDLIKQEPDLTDRKKRAAEMSGFTQYKEQWVEKTSFYWLTRVYNDRKFREWCVMQQELEEKQEARWKKIDEEATKDPKQFMEAQQKKGTLRQQAMEIHKALDVLESEIFGENDDLKRLANEMLLTTPEEIASAYR